ncbi:MAG: hypothetical protein N3C12_02590 [Candidatus Binatia bacterium]|nr:hypothetical protein [Candidatus Binatia bacterium]
MELRNAFGSPLKVLGVLVQLLGSAMLLSVLAAPLLANDCVILLPLFQQGLSDAEIAAQTRLPFAVVESCRRELSRPLPAGPAGVPPAGAVGPPPGGAAGRPPSGAAGPPPFGAPGPPPVGRDIQRLPKR